MEARTPLLRKLRVDDPQLRRLNTLEVEVVPQAKEKHPLRFFVRNSLSRNAWLACDATSCAIKNTETGRVRKKVPLDVISDAKVNISQTC